MSGNVTVDCINGDGIAVFAEPAEATSNTVFFFVGSPLALVAPSALFVLNCSPLQVS